MIDGANLSATHGIKKSPSVEGGKKPKDAMILRKVDARNMYIYICLQSEELFSHLSAPVLLRESMSPILSGSTSEHRGYNDSIDFYRHRGLERRGFNKHRGFEHRGSNDHRSLNKHRGFIEHRGS
jgi:hypothetical protein